MAAASEGAESDEAPETYLAQRYVDSPYLVGGRKFDLRIYALVTCYNPLKVYLYRCGGGGAAWAGAAAAAAAEHNVPSACGKAAGGCLWCTALLLQRLTGVTMHAHWHVCLWHVSQVLP